MTVQQLQYVLEVYKVGSITQTAKKFFVAPPTVSNAISTLEKELGYPVFVRSRHGVSLTSKGAWVVEHAQQVCDHMRQIEEGAPIVAAQPFRLETGLYLPATKAFTRLLEEHRDRMDRVFQQRHTNERREALNHVATGAADLAVLVMISKSMSKFEQYSNRYNLSRQLRAVIPGVVRIGKGHRLYDMEQVDLRELKKEWLIDGPDRSTANATPLQWLLNFDPYRVLVQEDWQERYEMTAKGLGFQIGAKLPEYLDRQYGFRSIPVPGLEYHVISITNPALEARPETARYLELLDEELRQV